MLGLLARKEEGRGGARSGLVDGLISACEDSRSLGAACPARGSVSQRISESVGIPICTNTQSCHALKMQLTKLYY